MTDGSDETLQTLRLIEDELSKIASKFTEGTPIDSSVSRSLLLRQAQLLVEKATFHLTHKATDRAQDAASQSIAVLQGLLAVREPAFRKRRDTLEARAWAQIGLAQIQRQDWFAARHTIGRLSLFEGDAPVELLELQVLLADAERSRRRRLEEMLEQSSISASVEPHWSAVEATLDRLMQEIAVRIAGARAILATVPFPDRFEAWLVETLKNHLSIAKPDHIPTVFSEETEGLIAEARRRGRDLQAKVWESGEMYYARNFKPTQEGESRSDEMLEPARQAWLLGLPHPDDPTRFAYPKWQFGEATSEAIRDALGKLRGLPEWSRWAFFHASSPVLRGLTPLQLMGLGDAAEAIEQSDARLREIEMEFENRAHALAAATESHLAEEE